MLNQTQIYLSRTFLSLSRRKKQKIMATFRFADEISPTISIDVSFLQLKPKKNNCPGKLQILAETHKLSRVFSPVFFFFLILFFPYLMLRFVSLPGKRGQRIHASHLAFLIPKITLINQTGFQFRNSPKPIRFDFNGGDDDNVAHFCSVYAPSLNRTYA